MGLWGLPERSRCGAGVPQCEWPIVLPKGWELRVSLYPTGKAPLGANNPGREVEVVIRVFIGDQASSKTVGNSAFGPSLVTSSLGDGNEGWASKRVYCGLLD